MLRQFYMELKSEFYQCITKHRTETDSAQLVQNMWFAMFRFVRMRPQDPARAEGFDFNVFDAAWQAFEKARV
jgi:hypothetical protein